MSVRKGMIEFGLFVQENLHRDDVMIESTKNMMEIELYDK